MLLTTETVHNTDVETSVIESSQKTENNQPQIQSSPSIQETVADDTVNASDDALLLTNETVQNAVNGFYLESQSLVQADESTNELKGCQVDEFAKPTNKECLESEKEESKNDDVVQIMHEQAVNKTQVETTVFEGDWSSMSIQDKIELDRPLLKSTDGFAIQLASLDHIETMAKFLNEKTLSQSRYLLVPRCTRWNDEVHCCVKTTK